MDILILLSLFAVKHWLIDFVFQSQKEIEHKGTYLDYRGITHSIKHGIATAIIMMFAGLELAEAFMIGSLDFLIHYHIDWAKSKINARFNWHPEFNKEFWWLLGLDQTLHTLTYLGIVAIMLL